MLASIGSVQCAVSCSWLFVKAALSNVSQWYSSTLGAAAGEEGGDETPCIYTSVRGRGAGCYCCLQELHLL